MPDCLRKKRTAYAAYKQAREDMKELYNVKSNVEHLLEIDERARPPTGKKRGSSFFSACGIQRSLNAQPSPQVAILGFGECHQQAFCEDRPSGRLAKFANLYKFALFANFVPNSV